MTTPPRDSSQSETSINNVLDPSELFHSSPEVQIDFCRHTRRGMETRYSASTERRLREMNFDALACMFYFIIVFSMVNLAVFVSLAGIASRPCRWSNESSNGSYPTGFSQANSTLGLNISALNATDFSP
jgi:post-segregation antitoxin (ccd killing protein)